MMRAVGLEMVLMLLGASVTAHATDLERLMNNLEVGMTPYDVRNLLGFIPYYSNVQTCGSNTPVPWGCRIEHYYSDGGHKLYVYYQGAGGYWEVNSWDFY